MKSIEIDPRWLEFGSPALLAGLVLGVFAAMCAVAFVLAIGLEEVQQG